MLKARHHSKIVIFAALILGSAVSASPVYGAEAGVEFKRRDTSLYKDISDQNFYYEFTNLLHLERLYSKVTGKKPAARNINIYDEVPDGFFFTNRHFRKRLSLAELEKGSADNNGPDVSNTLKVISGKFEGLHPGFFVEDARGDRYLLKFDPVDFMELATAAEVISNRFYHAFGYNVPQYTIAYISAGQFQPIPEAKIVDDSGFTKQLTQERLDEYLLFIPQDSEGRYRASASKVLPGVSKGSVPFYGRRKNDPSDLIDHKDRREFRALQVFASWMGSYDIRDSNSLSMEVEENGKRALKHYLIDFNVSFGAGTDEGKPPMTDHEHLVDYGEAAKAFLSLGLWEKPWQRRWREADEKMHESPAVGYFDNRYFDPGKFKVQLPHFAFKDLTRADGYWAAKSIMNFTNDEIKTMVKTGQFTNPADADYIANTLIERRDMVGRYWFERAATLENFRMDQGALHFNDLAVQYGFHPAEGVRYFAEIFDASSEKLKRIHSAEFTGFSLNLTSLLQGEGRPLAIFIRKSLPGSNRKSPYVMVETKSGSIQGILHED